MKTPEEIASKLFPYEYFESNALCIECRIGAVNAMKDYAKQEVDALKLKIMQKQLAFKLDGQMTERECMVEIAKIVSQ